MKYCVNGAFGSPVWQQKPDDGASQGDEAFALRELLHEYHVCTAFRKRNNRPLAVLADNRVHFPVAEARAVRLLRTLVDTDPSGNVPDLCRAVRTSVTVVFHPVPAMGSEPTGLIRADMTVYELVRDTPAAPFHPCRYLLGRPVLILE